MAAATLAKTDTYYGFNTYIFCKMRRAFENGWLMFPSRLTPSYSWLLQAVDKPAGRGRAGDVGLQAAASQT